MANKEKTTQNGQKPAKPRKKRRGLGGLIRLLLLALIAMIVVSMVSLDDGAYFAGLRRWLIYGDSGTEDNRYSYASDQNHRFALLEDNLLVVSLNEILLLADDGTALFERQVQMSAPEISVGKSQAVVCDVGGSSLYVLEKNGAVREMSPYGSAGYYAARLNSRDYLAVTEQKSGYKAAVTVYNAEGEKLFSFDSHDHYITEAFVTEDCRSLVAVSLSSQDGVFAATLLVYDLSRGERVGAYSIRDALSLETIQKDGSYVSLCDTKLSVMSRSGEKLLDYTYGNLYLHDYTLTGDGFSALLMGRYKAGNICQLTTFSDEGSRLASIEVTEEVLDLSAAGDYLAVLYSDELVVYTKDLHEHARLDSTDHAGQIIMESGGTVLLISGTDAWRYFP